MSKRRRILNHVRSNLVAYIALTFALSGSASAAGGLLVYSGNIVDGQVFSVDVADDNLTGVDVQNGGLTGADIAAGSLTGFNVAANSLPGFDIRDNSLPGSKVTDNSLTGADVADNSLTGADIAESTLSVAELGCQSGKVLGFARVHGKALTQDGISGWTSDPRYIDITNNCAGGPVEVKGSGGFYEVRFVGNPAALALVSPYQEDLSDIDNIASVAKYYNAVDGGFFSVFVEDVCATDDGSLSCIHGGTTEQSGSFTIVLP